MKDCLKIFFSLLLSVIIPSAAAGQAKVYTKKELMSDFLTRTTKVVISGSNPMELALKSEVSTRWVTTPYEFCTIEEYGKLQNNNEYYFLRLTSDDGVVFLSLAKGGKENDSNRIKRGFEVVRLPIAADGMFSGEEVMLLGAFLDIIQDFAESAMTSDRIGYSGLMHCNTKKMNGKTIMLDAEDAAIAVQNREADMVVPVFIVPQNGSHGYKMLISTDTYELLYFSRFPVKNDNTPDRFGKTEILKFKARNANIAGNIPD